MNNGNLPLQKVIEKIEACMTEHELRKYLADLILDVKYSNTYLEEAWEVAVPNPVERNRYMEVAQHSIRKTIVRY
jgi:hypothetical protein